jgi:hypothetical protein
MLGPWYMDSFFPQIRDVTTWGAGVAYFPDLNRRSAYAFALPQKGV